MSANPTMVDEIFALFHRRGDSAYVGEPVSLSEHMLQTAHAAELDGAGPTLVAAALLHDVGHLLHDLPENVAEEGIDTHHDDLAFNYLSQYFIDSVVEPVRLHVAAKRYLCAVDPAYLEALSPASVLGLELQGGPFDAAERVAFERSPYFEDAVRLRRYDDIGKIPDAATPELESYRLLLIAALR